MRVNLPKHRILEAVGKFQYLSALQLTTLLFSRGSHTYTQENVSQLKEWGYLNQLHIPTLTSYGRPRAFYCLSDKGYKYLGDPTLPNPPRFKDSTEPYRNALFLKHSEQANDLVIMAHNLPRADGRFTLTRSLTEAQLKKRRVKVKPDGWIELTATKTTAIAFEMDRATESRDKWKAKVAAYSEYIRGEYQRDFQSEFLTIATVTSTQRRLQELLSWTEEALKEVNDFGMAQILYFASFDPVETSPAQAFLSPIWVTLDDPAHQQLLPEDIFG
jgi:hypothetical protein